MKVGLEELTHQNFVLVAGIDRSDISEDVVDNIETVMELTDYGVEHGCLGHTFAIKRGDAYVGWILLGEAIAWETDPPEMRKEPFYRLMSFVVDRRYRRDGVGGKALEMAVEKVYGDFGVRPIALGCHKDNALAAKFYEKHGFKRTEYAEGDDLYYLKYPEK